ncbi:TPA: transmembrane anchored protein [Cronobacter sakazakii]|uniref:transmembrane anchored protein n=1 Tax=Cronobacter sakazakii TaxID=28141 RepID=UPI000A18BAB0|nr:transmembrane anchored protein [Cronobacter sakazakii]EIZ8816837.1 transmembrane anchored protein [Cronobacter sakazakii]ELY4089583.1 transmembrane anchored protein [Cronobacter sakazakii]ELY4224958.1 transmembrane anchored protein [Cronobacter sakazakii]EMC4334344.1 transmembrane anchored protein [Cronobacter sakazakii]EME1731754.1 transmembrane anchored protein [Cronobacter sakazakii]
MKKVIAVLFVLLSLGSVTQAYAACNHDSDTAADGSRCGGRSADSRPGGGGIR